jgi:hypothetical protein
MTNAVLWLRPLWRWLGVRLRQSGEQCASCVYFGDFRDSGDDPDEADGYCGNQNHIDAGGYGGHWTHSSDWCGLHESGESLANLSPVHRAVPTGEAGKEPHA